LGAEVKVRVVEVWEVDGLSLWRFRCVQRTATSEFAVVCADLVSESDSLDVVFEQERTFREQMSYVSELRYFESVELAIADHNEAFGP
jgi:hypothetical protein